MFRHSPAWNSIDVKGLRASVNDHCANGAMRRLTYRAGGIDYRVDHGAFFQVNRWLSTILSIA